MDTVNKYITSTENVREAKRYLSKQKVSNFTGFGTNLIIKINITTPKGKSLLITYTFKHKYLYFNLRHFLKELLNIKLI